MHFFVKYRYLKQKYLYITYEFDPIFHNHPIIRNYYKIVSNPNYIQPEIGEYIILPTQESVAILKTFWIRIIQRRWRKIYQARQRLIKERSTMGALRERQLTGQWPRHLRQWPAGFT